MAVLLNPKRHDRHYPDARSTEVMRQTIDFFERKGKRRLKEDYHARVWYADFLDFVRRESNFATMCTPAAAARLMRAEWVRRHSCHTGQVARVIRMTGRHGIRHQGSLPDE
jgi:hypothetical protein